MSDVSAHRTELGGQDISAVAVTMREEIKQQTIKKRRLQHQAAAAKTQTQTEPSLEKRFSSPPNPDDGHSPQAGHDGQRKSFARRSGLRARRLSKSPPNSRANFL